jgi:pSer/pThr/pTyr-binding forkhead associated (FHA) protein/outer membrane biosynthesis protein TonB
MEEISKEQNRYELVSEDLRKSFPISKKRILIGSTEACDILISHSSVSTIHAVLEKKKGQIKIYDMDSENGTIVNGKRVNVATVGVGDLIVFGDYGVKLDVCSSVPPVFNIEDNLEIPGPLEVAAPPVFSKRISKQENNAPGKGSYDVEEYPLSKLKNAEFSRYIFEDADEVKNILHFDNYQEAVEFIILKKEEIISIEYRALEKNPIFFKGSGSSRDSVEFAYLGKDQKIMAINSGEGVCDLVTLEGFNLTSISDNDLGEGQTITALEKDAIYCLKHDDIRIFVRRTLAPPLVLTESFLKNDPLLWKYLGAVIGCVLLFLFVVGIFEVDKEELEKKNPQRLASILYKKPVLSTSVAKTKNKSKKIIQKSKSAKPSSKKQKTVVKKKSKANVVQKRTKQRQAPPKKAVAKRPKPSPVKSKGKVDTYKSVDFSSSISSLQSRGGVQNTKFTKTDVSDSYEKVSGKVSPGAAKLADVVGDSESKISDSAGDLSSSGSLNEFSEGKSVAVAGIPSRTVVLGGMDPDTIRKILMDHLPQFRFCYQKELDRSKNEFSGRVELNFIIGASGHVTKAGVLNASVPGKVRACVVNVLKGIPFPEPRGGGVVEVTQPMNFYSNVR